MSCAIGHPTDKGLDPYMSYWPNYMQQGIKEHLDVREKYTRLSPDEATEEKAEQKKLFLKAFKKYSG